MPADPEPAAAGSDNGETPYALPPKETPEPEPAPAPKKNFVITTGVHGNEPSGYYIKDQLAELGFNVYGPCNPWGIENNNRHLEDGRDLNRMFGRTDCPEAEKIKEWLNENKPDFLLDLHEDPDGTAPYLIQHGPDDDIGRKIIDALKDDYDFDPAPKFMMVTGEDGLLKPELNVLRLMALAKIYGLAYYAWANFDCTAIVVECPGSWDVEKRKAYHLAVCKTAKRIFEEQPEDSGD
ncbi:MAG: succinylglutamate desuccinylase/aspartoacylase family protein [Planctomycetes bacterium]|nr:succinylglutamate desuccinylase/aspartoacylase family protein [Planctomycetota bacterium]